MRLIDADALQNEYKQSHEGKRLLLIDVAPTIEPIRCEECKHWNDENGWCRWHREYIFNAGYFCADAVRKEGDSE